MADFSEYRKYQQASGDYVLSVERIENVLKQVRYKNWKFLLNDWQGFPTLRVLFEEEDAYNPESDKVEQLGRPWLLEPKSESELLQTVWLAIMTAEEHEARERFMFELRRVFSPHLDHTRRRSEMLKTPATL